METLIVGEALCSINDVVFEINSSATKELVEKWPELAKRLGTRDVDIYQLQLNFNAYPPRITLMELFYSIIARWTERFSNEASLRALCSVLEEYKLINISRHLQSHFSALNLVYGHKENIYWIPKPEYYVNRTLRIRTILHPTIFKEHCKDIFLIQGISLHELRNLAYPNTYKKASEQIREVSTRFIRQEDEQDFERIRKMVNVPLHWIVQTAQNCYSWVKSHKRVDLIQRFIHENQETITEDKFMAKYLDEFTTTPTCISDSPGMGKTILLKGLAEKAKERYSNCDPRIVLFMTLKELVQDPIVDENNNRWNPLALILKHARRPPEVLKHVRNTKFELFLDGFDEVLPTQLTKTKKLLKSIMELPNTRIHVTTRPHMKKQLERCLGVIAFCIDPFTPTDQIEFLTKFWIHENKADDTPHLKEFASKCLNQLISKMTDVDDDDRKIAGVPLQCQILAEVYSEQAVKYSKGSQDYEILVDVSSISGMYSKLMEKKYSKVEDPRLKGRLRVTHLRRAVKELFETEQLRCLEKKLRSLKDVPLQELYIAGVMEPQPTLSEPDNEPIPQFVHRTIAEYIIAEYLVTEVSENNCMDCLRFLMETVLEKCVEVEEDFLKTFGGQEINVFKFQYPVIAYFADALLQEAPEKKLCYRLKILGGTYPMLIACCRSDLPNIFKFIMETLPPNPVKSWEISLMMLLTAQYSNYYEPILTRIQQMAVDRKVKLEYPHSSLHQTQITPLHLAAHRGSFGIFNFLVDHLNNIPPYTLRFCIKNSVLDPSVIIGEKKNIINLIIDIRTKNVKEDERVYEIKKLKWIQSHIHKELITFLVDIGININSVDEQDNTLLHLAFERLDGKAEITSETYEGIVNLVENKVTDKHWDAKNKAGRSPLHLAVENINPKEEVLEKFKTKGANFDSEDLQGISVFMAAIRGGRTYQLLEKLVDRFKCKFKRKKGSKWSPMLLAASVANTDAVKFLLSRNTWCIYDLDSQNRTPLHLAILQRTKEHEVVQETLIDNGAYLKHGLWSPKSTAFCLPGFSKSCRRKGKPPSSLENIPLVHAFKEEHGLSLNIVSKMEEKGLKMRPYANVVLTNMMINTKLGHDEVLLNDYTNVFQYFVQRGGKLNIHDIQGAMCDSDTREHLETVTKLDLALDNKLRENGVKGDIRNLGDLYRKVRNREIPLETFLLSLLQCEQVGAFQAVRRLFHDGREFLTAPPGVQEFFESGDERDIFVLNAIDLGICYRRVLQTVTGIEEYHIGEEVLQNEKHNYVVKVKTLTLDILGKIVKLESNSKFLVIAEVVKEKDEVKKHFKVYKDEIRWTDLSRTRQLEDCQLTGFRLKPESKLKFLQMLKGRELIELMKERKYCTENLGVKINHFVNAAKLKGKQLILEQIAVASFAKEMNLSGNEYRYPLVSPNEFPDFLENDENESNRLKFKNECIRWYFLAWSIIRRMNKHQPDLMYEALNFDRLTLIEPNEGKGLLAKFTFQNDLLMYFIDMVVGNTGTSLKINFDIAPLLLQDYMEGLFYCNAHHLIRLLVRGLSYQNYKMNNVPELFYLLFETKNYPENWILERKYLFKSLTKKFSSRLQEKYFYFTRTNLETIHMDLVKEIIEACTNYNLHESIEKTKDQYEELVQYFCGKGKVKEIFNARSRKQQQCTLLHRILIKFDLHKHTLQVLASSGVNFNAVDNFGVSVLFYAIKNERSRLVLEGLVEGAGQGWKKRGENNYTVLHQAASCSNINALKFFLALPECEITARDASGRNFAHVASATFSLEKFKDLVGYLLENQKVAEVFNSVDDTPQPSPLHKAIENLELDSATLQLLHSGRADFNAVDQNGNNALFYAVRYQRELRMITALVTFGADWEHKDLSNRNLLHQAALYGNDLDIVQYLIRLFVPHRRRYEVNHRDNAGFTPLHIICQRWSQSLNLPNLGITTLEKILEIAQILVQNNADMNLKDNMDNTPVYYAGNETSLGRYLEIEAASRRGESSI